MTIHDQALSLGGNVGRKMKEKETDCGRHYEHAAHLYEVREDKVKMCDGTFRENKV